MTPQEIFNTLPLYEVVHLIDHQSQQAIGQYIYDKVDQLNQSDNRGINWICREVAQMGNI